MGAAIESFAGARLLCVPRTRFVPVKTTDDLLVLRSDAYRLTTELDGRAGDAGRRSPSSSSTRASTELLDDFERALPRGPPSLRDAGG